MKEGKKKEGGNPEESVAPEKAGSTGTAEGDHQGGESSREAADGSTEDLKKTIEGKEREARENYDRFLRMAADYENFKKRAARDKEDWIKFANEDLLKAMLPFIDNLERAVSHAEKVADTGC